MVTIFKSPKYKNEGTKPPDVSTARKKALILDQPPSTIIP